MDAVKCFWTTTDSSILKRAYERLVGGAILDLDETELTTLFLATVQTQSQYKTAFRHHAQKNPHCKTVLAIVKAIRKKFTVYYLAEKEATSQMYFRLSNGVLPLFVSGWHANYWAHYFSRLLRTTVEPIVDFATKKAIESALDLACCESTGEELHKRILEDLPVILISGYTAQGDKPGHHAPILFWGPWVILCDSPNKHDSNTGSFLQVYLYDRQLLLPEALEKLKATNYSNEVDFYSHGFRELLQTLKTCKHKKSDQEFILEALNGYHPHVDALCHLYCIESILLAFLLINDKGKVLKPHERTLETWPSQIMQARAIHSELIFLATLDRLKRYVSQFKVDEVIGVGLDGLLRRWTSAERLSHDRARWAPDGLWAQKCRQQLPKYFDEITFDRNTSQYFEEALEVKLVAGRSVGEELESLAIKGDWQTLAKWASYGVDLQLVGPSDKSPLEHLFATSSDDVTITLFLLNQIKMFSSAEQQAAAKYLAVTNVPNVALYLVSRGISCAEVDKQGFNVILKVMGAAHPFAASIEHMARLNGDYAALRSAYKYFRLQGISMSINNLEPSCAWVMVQYWINWFQDTVGCGYEAIVDLTTSYADRDLTLQRIQKGALTPLFFITERKFIGCLFYQGWLISIDSSINIHKIGQDEEAQSMVKAFMEDPANEWQSFNNYFDSELLTSDAYNALATIETLLQNRYVLGVLEGIYLAQDACMNMRSRPTTAEQVVEAICSQSEKLSSRQRKINQLLMQQYALQDDLPCKEVQFAIDQELVRNASRKINDADALSAELVSLSLEDDDSSSL